MTTRFQQLAMGWASAGAIFLAAASQSPPDAAAAWTAAVQSTAIDPSTASRIAQLSRDHVVRSHAWRPPAAAPLELVVMTTAAATAQPLIDGAEQVLQRYAEWLGPLPLARLTIVELPGHLDLSTAAYPGIAAARVRFLTGRREFAIERDMTASIARQYALALVNGPGPDAWFAEGLAAFLATRPLEFRFEPRPALTLRYFGGYVPHSIRAISAGVIDPRPSRPDLAQFFEPAGAPWQLARGAERERARRFALALHSLERFVGWPALQAMLRSFWQDDDRRRALLDEFREIVSAQRGDDMTWFFDQALRMDARFDYAVVNITSMPAPADGWQTTVDVRRLGEATFDGTSLPRAASTARALPVVTRFADGAEITEWIDGRDAEWRFEYASAAAAATASVDPEAMLLLDADRANNTRTVNPQLREAAVRLAFNWLSWLQDAMLACTAVI